MTTISAQISTKYQVVIPKEVRELMNLQPKDTLLFLIDGGTVVLRPKPKNFTKTLRGLHRHLWSESEQWLGKERSSWE
jgi:AbrB family looped-hinge helix DNA binding protein